MRELRYPSRDCCEHCGCQLHRRRRFRRCWKSLVRRSIAAPSALDCWGHRSYVHNQRGYRSARRQRGRSRVNQNRPGPSGIFGSAAASNNRSRHRGECQCHDQSDRPIRRLHRNGAANSCAEDPEDRGLEHRCDRGCVCLFDSGFFGRGVYLCVRGKEAVSGSRLCRWFR